MPEVTAESLLDKVQQLSDAWSKQRADRQRRRSLDVADFDALRDAGWHLGPVPADIGGLWRSNPESTRPLAEALRVLAHGDPSVALVSSMHPAVLQPYAEVSDEASPGWLDQRRWIFETVLQGAFWGTIVSEPGSGGDMRRTRAELSIDGPTEGRLSGRKHFGSGSGVTSCMVTTGLATGDTGPTTLFLSTKDVPWDGSTGMKLAAEWDGHGMAATQSHSFTFEDFPATICLLKGRAPQPSFYHCLFSGVVLGVVETAMQTARQELGAKLDATTHYQRSEWSQAELEAWTMQQAYEGILREVEHPGPQTPFRVLQGKTSMAQLAESLTLRLCRIMGGSTYGRGSPYGTWFEDVRALGFLRPPWVLAFDNLWDMSWPQT
jgi:alkylation response protein AidB-like acyl-CoA dehydrogenase